MTPAHSALVSEWHYLSQTRTPSAEVRMAWIEERLAMFFIRPDECKPDKDWTPPPETRMKLKIEDHYTPEFLAGLGEWEKEEFRETFEFMKTDERLITFTNNRGKKVRLPMDMTMEDCAKLGITVRLAAPGSPLKKNEYVHNPNKPKPA